NCTLDLPFCDCLTYEDVSRDAFVEAGASVETLLMEIHSSLFTMPDERDRVEGFRNWATWNAALTIQTDRVLYLRAKGMRLAGDSCREAFKADVKFCYGVDWAEVAEYLREIITTDSAPSVVPGLFGGTEGGAQ